ncbi:MAG: DUF3298 domain-containing protein [Oliverpabstia sp.]
MKKKFKIIMSLSIMLLMLASCGNQQTKTVEEASSEDKTEAGKAEETQAEDKQTDGSEKKQAVASETKKNKVNAQETESVKLLGVETGLMYDYYWDEEFEYYAASLEYPIMNLSETDRDIYPELENAVARLMDERKESRQELYSEAIQSSKEADPEYRTEYEVSEKVTVRRADTAVLSLLLDGYYYMGGAHGAPYRMGVTFDTETGEKLKLTDVVTDVEKLPELVEEQLDIFWGLEVLYEDLDLNEFFDEYIDSVQWVLDYHGITFYFNPYEIAPYASGSQSVTISFAEHPEIFNEQYLEVPACYSVELVSEMEFYYDVDGNGTLDSILVSGTEGEYGEYQQQKIWLNDVWYEEDVESFQIEPMLMHMNNGKNYLYIGQQYPNDYWVYSIYDLSDGAIENIDSIYSGRHSVIDMEKEYYARQVITDPQSFILDTRTDVLGTVSGYDSYHVGENGLPEKEHDGYFICEEREFTMLKNLTVSTVDEEGNITGNTELKKGDKVVYYRTDGENWADLILADGSIARVNLEHSDWFWTINGSNLEDVFDGIMFAG